MKLERQIVDTDTGEIKSRGSLGENSNFLMLFRKEISSLIAIQKDDAKAGALFLFFMEHMDKSNALIASQDCIAEIFGWSIPTVKRKLQILKDKGFISIKRTGNSSIYFINANIVWSTYGNKKQYAHFHTSIIISKSEQEYKIKSSAFKKINLVETTTD